MTYDLLGEIYNCRKCEGLKEYNKTFYMMENRAPKCAIIMQNPDAATREDELEEISRINQSNNYWDNTSLQRDSLKKWVLSNKHFFDRFFTALKSHGIIGKYDGLQGYLDDGLVFNEFYFTDIVKCRGATEILNDDMIGACSAFLEKELSILKNITILFAISSRTWDIIRNKYHPGMLSKIDGEISSNKLTKVHGYLFECKIGGRDFFIIPLVHMSRRNFTKLLRNSYFEYLEEGLRDLKSAISKQASHQFLVDSC